MCERHPLWCSDEQLGRPHAERCAPAPSSRPRDRAGAWDEAQRTADELLDEFDEWMTGSAEGATPAADPYGLSDYVRRRTRPLPTPASRREVPAEYWRTIA